MEQLAPDEIINWLDTKNGQDYLNNRHRPLINAYLVHREGDVAESRLRFAWIKLDQETHDSSFWTAGSVTVSFADDTAGIYYVLEPPMADDHVLLPSPA